MNYTLMHKNVFVVDMEIDIGRIARLFNLQTPEHLPLGVLTKNGLDRKKMNDWWIGRSIPASRDGIRDVLENLNIFDTAELPEKCFGLSLSDQYWICPKGSGLRWEDVNFFQNDFSKDMGEILFGRSITSLSHVSLISPDNTSDGWLRKKWIIADGKRILMKGGSKPYEQEPFNEVIAAAVLRRLNIPHADYKLIFEKNRPYSLCENFITPETELIPAWRINEVHVKDNHDSNNTHFLRCCETLFIPCVKESLDKMLVFDYIISNEDRHFNNFGFVRNADTLEWIGFAPIFDSGTSLWYNTGNHGIGHATACKPFKDLHNEQIKLVGDLSWFNANALEGLDNEIKEILSYSKSEDISEERRNLISAAVIKQYQRIVQIIDL